MGKNRAWIFIALGLLLAVGAGALVYVVLQQQASAPTQSPAEQAAVPTLKLPVAARQLEIGARITPSDYLLKDFPLDLVPVSAITDTAKLDNQVVISTITQGGTFQANQFLGAEAAPISDRVAPGNVVLAFPAADLLSSSAVIRDGDRLDLLLTIDPPAATDGAPPQRATLMTVQNIEVLQVLAPPAAEGEPPPKPSALLLSVTPQDAVLIKYVKDSGGVIDFALRSRLDQDQHQAPPVTYEEFSQTYGIR